ncbi:hypothetical protein COCCADRAFT_9980 [Bipolaris zeicola 26-R-13]|uniref:Reticulon domain-containing protein n=1 Tax=Cochliobolus carbonum (strain 26-R-13) TaxID=930089 RepID=W6Y8L9_COCC2|nr:uncharacterized protein COCCADRAFT_9980 [Bipolaris zeicola 26-R-13]EUC27431.1 hypothetical protein COCCADRAFT_9980 [Bipolaris zeicola 26-R-13]
MSTQNVIVVPVAGEGARQPGQDTTEIATTIQHALEENAHPTQPQPGPLKQIIAHQESLYQYINWNDPTRTLGSYIGVLSLLFGAHYLPLTQMALKGGVTALGLVSVTESASRMLGNRSLSAQLRPKEYKTFPEPTLNATLKDIHDFVQYAAVQTQRIVFGQDLQKTFASFLGLTALYWLVKAVPPFWLAVLAVTSIYAAPLIASPRGREIAREAGTNAQELAAAATHNGRMLAHDASFNAQKLANTVTETSRAAAQDATARVGSLANSTKETGRAATNSISSGAQEVANQGNALAQKGKQTASDLSSQAKGTASQVSSSATGSLKHAQQAGSNAAQRTVDTATSAANHAANHAASTANTAANYTKDHAYTNAHGPTVYSSSPTTTTNNHGSDRASTHRGPEADRTTPRGIAASSNQPAYTGAKVTEAQEPAVMYTTARDEALERSVLERSRGVV